MPVISFEEAVGQPATTPVASGPAKPSSGNLISFEEATGTAPAPSVLGFLKDKQFRTQLGHEAGSIADLVLSMPAFIAQVGATGVADLVAAVRGSDKPLKEGGETIQRAMETPWMKFLMAPIATIRGTSEEQQANTTVGKALGGISGAIDRAAEYWSEKTGSTETGEALKQATQIAMAKGGDTFVKGFKEWAGKNKVLVPETPDAEVKPAVVDPAVKTVKEYTEEVLGKKPAETITPVKELVTDIPAAEVKSVETTSVPDETSSISASETPVSPGAVSDSLNPYKIAGVAAATGAAGWAMQDQLTDEQLAGLGLGAAGLAGSLKLHGVPETRLIEMLKLGGEGRESAAAQIYRDNVPKLARGLQKYVRQGVEVDDVIQRTMEKGLRALEKGQFSGDAAIATYLYRIAENEAKTGLRYEKVRPKTESLDMTEQAGLGRDDATLPSAHEQIADPNARTPEQQALDSALGRRMSDALDKLPPEFREPFELRELQGLEYSEIAEKLDQPIGTVRSQISRAKEKLQRSLAEYRQEAGVSDAVVRAGNTERSVFAPSGQRGAISPTDLFGLAAVVGGGTLGAFLSDETPIKGALYGALAGGLMGTELGRGMVKKAAKAADPYLGLISTRLGNIAPELKGKMREHEHRVLVGLATVHDQVTPFLSTLRAQPAGIKELVARDLMNGKTDTLKTIPALAKSYPAVRATLDNLQGQLQRLGRFKEGLGEYFPRIVKDLDGLKGALSQQVREGLDHRLMESEAEMNRKQQRALTEVERSVVINRYLFGKDSNSHLPGYAKERGVREVTDKLQPFYESPTESLLRYVSGAVSDIETARFFGRDLAKNTAGQKTFTNVDGSIGNLTGRLLEEGKITNAQAAEVRKILQSRFVGGEKSMNPALAAVRDSTNAALLGQVASAATQIGDSFATVYHFGLTPTLQAITAKLIGKERVTPAQLGLVNHLAEELAGKSLVSRALQNSLKWTGFTAIDMFAKDIGINAALAQARKLAATPKGQVKLAERYGYAFEGKIPELISDLRSGKITENTQRLAFEAISDIQPVSKAEMPEAYLNHSNGRILYQLKTYMLKQADIVRRDAYQNIASGDKARIMKGLKNLGGLVTLYALSNVPGDVVKDWLSGRDSDPFSTPRIVENVLQTFGLNRYTTDRLSQGKVVDTAIGMITPPLSVLEDIARGKDKAISYIPGVGRQIYDRAFDGNEKREIAEKRRENKGLPKGTGQPLSDAAKAYVERKKEERKEEKRRAAQ